MKQTTSVLINPTSDDYHYDSLTDRLVIKRSEDVSAHLNMIQQQKNENSDGWTDRRTMRKIGSIPMSVAAKWLAEDGFDCMDPNNAKEVKRRLNTNAKLRTVDKAL
jgi:hypothetical protein